MYLLEVILGPGVTVVSVKSVKSTNQVEADLDTSWYPPVTKAWVELILKEQWKLIVTGKSFPSSELVEVMTSVDFKNFLFSLYPPMMIAWLGSIWTAEANCLGVCMLVEGIH